MTRLLSVDYNTAYSPPAPFLPIIVDGYNPDKLPVTLSAFVDSGADGTMLPKDILQFVGAAYEDTVQLRGVTGSAQRIDRYTVRICIESTTIHAIPAIATAAGSEPIIGRDVLNRLIVTLDGPIAMTEVRLG